MKQRSDTGGLNQAAILQEEGRGKAYGNHYLSGNLEPLQYPNCDRSQWIGFWSSRTMMLRGRLWAAFFLGRI